AERQPALELGRRRVREHEGDRRDWYIERGIAEYVRQLRALDIPGRRKRHGAAADEQRTHRSTPDRAEEVKLPLIETEVDRVPLQYEIVHGRDAILAWGQAPQLLENRALGTRAPRVGSLRPAYGTREGEYSEDEPERGRDHATFSDSRPTKNAACGNAPPACYSQL